MIPRWRQRGNVFLWRYRDKPRNFAGWHLSADPAGAESLLELFWRMHDAAYSSQHIVRISEPTPSVLSVPNYARGIDRWQSAHQWRVRYRKGKPAANDWHLAFAGNELQLSVGETHLLALIQGIVDLAGGRGDYAIAGEKAGEQECLWFWWWAG